MSAARKSAPKRMPRRTPDFVRPYLTRQELTLILEQLERAGEPESDLLDPSLHSAVTELRRWL